MPNIFLEITLEKIQNYILQTLKTISCFVDVVSYCRIGVFVWIWGRIIMSEWVIIPSWLFGSWSSFLYSSVYSCHLFLISSASLRPTPFGSFTEPIFAWNVPLVSLIFLTRSLVFPILLFPYISLHWSLRKAFLSLLAVLWNSEFKWVYLSFSPLFFTSLLFTAFCKACSDIQFAFLHFFSMGMVLIPVCCTMSWTSIQSSSGTLSDLAH